MVRLPKARVTLDIDHELLVWVTRHAEHTGKSRNEIIGQAVELFRGTTQGRMTTAERIAEMLGDGRRFETEDGRALSALVDDADGRAEQDRTGNLIRYVFPDGSAIVESAAMGAWDIEGSTPFSWAGIE